MNYYKVTAIKGHLGAGNGEVITFAFAAPDIFSAMQLARRMPGVKHTHIQMQSKMCAK